MVSQYALDGKSSSMHPDWPSLFEKRMRKDPKFLDLDFAGLQSWDPLASYASQAPGAEHIPGKTAHPSQIPGLGNQRSYATDAAGPSSTTRRLCTALQVPSGAGFAVSSTERLPAVRNPTGAPLLDRFSVASRSLLSPIDLESPSDQGILEIENRDPKIHISSPYSDEEFQKNGRLIQANAKGQIGTFGGGQAYSKAVDWTDKTPRPSAFQEGKPNTPSSHGETHSHEAGNFQLERLHHEMQECLMQEKRMRAIELKRLGEDPVMPIEGDPFVSGSTSRSTDVEDFDREAHKANSRYLPAYYGAPGSSIKTKEQSSCVERAHFTTVTSPSRPQIVTISRRGSSVRPVSQVDSPQPSSQSNRDCHPITPPEVPPITTPKTSRRIHEADETEAINRIAEIARAYPRPPITPPNSPVGRVAASSKVAYPEFVLKDLRRATYSVQRYQPVAWILDELEFLVGNYPSTRLQLDSPVIQHIRREIVTAVRSSAGGPQSTLHHLPHSRYSTRHRDSAFRSFWSHPLSHSCAEGFHGTEFHGLSPPSLGSPYFTPSFTSTPAKSTTFYALRKVFPHAPSHTLDCIQSTSFALAYVSSVCSSYDIPLSAPSIPVNGYYAVRPTAQEKLSQNVHSDAPRSGTSWLRPQTPEYLGLHISADKLESLTVSLNELFRKLLTEIDGRRLGTGDDALARAVHELIRLGENEGQKDEVGPGAGAGAGAGAEGRDGGGRASCGAHLERRCDWDMGSPPHEWVAR